MDTTNEAGAGRWGIMIPKDGSSRTSLTARYNMTYSTPPVCLTALSELRGTAINANELRAPSFAGGEPKLRSDGADLTLSKFPDPQTEIENCEISWMTSPSGIFESGVADVDTEVSDRLPNACGVKAISFRRTYNTPPKVCVFQQSLSWAYGGNQPDARTRVYVTDITTTGFNLHNDTWGGSCHEGDYVTWCAYDSSLDNVKVTGGSKTWGTLDLSGNNSPQKGETRYWEVDFGGKQPVAILTGITGVDLNISNNRRFHVECKVVGGLGPKTLIRYGPDSSIQARWVEVGFLAILQD